MVKVPTEVINLIEEFIKLVKEENIKIATENFITHNGVEKILNDNILKMLGRTKDKIGQGWIRKLLGISLEMNENEYKIACEKLGQEELEHEEEIKLKGKGSMNKSPNLFCNIEMTD